MRRDVAPDVRVSYLEWAPAPPDPLEAGAPNQPVSPADARGTIVLLHGGGLDSAELSWGDLGPRLAAQGYRVLAPDAPGYGLTPKASWLSTQENLVRYVGSFVDALGLDGFVLGGLSMGGALTLGYALENPDRLRGIIPMGSGGIMHRQRAGVWSRPLHLITWLSVRSGLMDATFDWFAGNRRLTELSLTQIVRDPLRRTPELMDAVLAEGTRPTGAHAFGEWQRDQILWDRIRTNYLPYVHHLKLPALVIHGGKDTGVRVACAEDLAVLLPDARLVVAPDAGHWVPRDAPELVSATIGDFLERVCGPE